MIAASAASATASVGVAAAVALGRGRAGPRPRVRSRTPTRSSRSAARRPRARRGRRAPGRSPATPRAAAPRPLAAAVPAARDRLPGGPDRLGRSRQRPSRASAIAGEALPPRWTVSGAPSSCWPRVGQPAGATRRAGPGRGGEARGRARADVRSCACAPAVCGRRRRLLRRGQLLPGGAQRRASPASPARSPPAARRPGTARPATRCTRSVAARSAVCAASTPCWRVGDGLPLPSSALAVRGGQCVGGLGRVRSVACADRRRQLGDPAGSVVAALGVSVDQAARGRRGRRRRRARPAPSPRCSSAACTPASAASAASRAAVDLVAQASPAPPAAVPRRAAASSRSTRPRSACGRLAGRAGLGQRRQLAPRPRPPASRGGQRRPARPRRARRRRRRSRSASRLRVAAARASASRCTDAGPLADALVDVQAEQVDQDLLPLGRLGVQEPGELALGQHDAAGELLVRQADRVEHGGVHLGRGAGQHGAEPVSPRSAGAASKAAGRSRAAAAPARRGRWRPCPCRRGGPPGSRRTARPDASKTSRTLASAGRGRQRVLDPPPVAPARHRAVEREADRVEHRGLARAGRADEGEEVGVGEVHCGRFAEDREPVQVQAQRPHAVTTSLVELVEQRSTRRPRRRLPWRRGTRRRARAATDRPAWPAGSAGVELGQRLRVDADLQRPGQQRLHLLAQAGPRPLPHVDPQPRGSGRRSSAASSASVPRTVRSGTAAVIGTARDLRRRVGGHLHNGHRRRVLLLAEVDRERASRSSAPGTGPATCWRRCRWPERDVVGRRPGRPSTARRRPRWCARRARRRRACRRRR